MTRSDDDLRAGSAAPTLRVAAPDLDIFCGVVLEPARIRRDRPDGVASAVLSIRTQDPVGEGPPSNNPVWPVVIWRQSAVELATAAWPGDEIQLTGVAQGGVIVVPRTGGRLEILKLGDDAM